MPERVSIEVPRLRALGTSILERRGADPQAAAQVVDVLLAAERNGVVTHGMTRLATYVERIDRGQLDPRARPEVRADAGGALLLDAHRGFGAVAAIAASDLAAERAAQHGCAWVTARDSNHFGIAGYYTRRLAERGLIAIACCNAGASVAPWGGRAPVVGTNPWSIAVPADPVPVVLDMAVTNVARGKIRRAAAEGRPIPEGWAVDAEGRPTSDPQAALGGMLAPIGGYKGYGLAVMAELLSGVLSGGPFGTEVRGATDMSGTAGVSFTLIALALGRLVPEADYRARVEQLRAMVEASAAAGQRVYLPGGPEQQSAQRIRAEGLALPADVAATLERLARG